MHRWQSGPMQWIANPQNRRFESYSVLQSYKVSLVTTAYVVSWLSVRVIRPEKQKGNLRNALPLYVQLWKVMQLGWSGD